jgi:hypothetical protein
LVWLQRQGFTAIEGVDSSTQQVQLARSAGLKVEEAEVLAWLAAQTAGAY